MSEQDDNFLSRWSRRKALVRQGVEPPPAAVPLVAVVPAAVVAAKPPAEAAEVLALLAVGTATWLAAKFAPAIGDLGKPKK